MGSGGGGGGGVLIRGAVTSEIWRDKEEGEREGRKLGEREGEEV